MAQSRSAARQPEQAAVSRRATQLRGARPAHGRALNVLQPSSPAEVLALQQTVGNRAVQQLLAAHTIQAKLRVGAANDAYEREADRVASQVVRATGGAAHQAAPQTSTSKEETSSGRAAQRLVQRAPARAVPPTAAFDAGPAVEGKLTANKGGGKSLPDNVRARMEAGFGADFSRVRIHTDAQAGQLNRQINAQAFTHGNHIYFDRGQYSPHTSAGQHLLAHELTHVVQQTGSVQRRSAPVQVRQRMPANHIGAKRRKLHLDFVRMKRLDPKYSKTIFSVLGMDKVADKKGGQGGTYGHWWTEIGDMKGKFPGEWKPVESYGWWPSKAVGVAETFKGVPGALNQGQRNDPHHGEDVSKSQMFHPVMEIDTDTEDYATVREKVVGDIRSFAKGYSGIWNWVFGWGKNCHTFQQKMKTRVGIHYQKGTGWFTRPDNVSSLEEAGEKEREKEAQAEFNAKNPGIDFQLEKELDLKGLATPDTTAEVGAIIRVPQGEDDLDYSTVPDWGEIMVAYNRKHYRVYKDALEAAGKRLS